MYIHTYTCIIGYVPWCRDVCRVRAFVTIMCLRPLVVCVCVVVVVGGEAEAWYVVSEVASVFCLPPPSPLFLHP